MLIRIATDSTADLPLKYIDRYQIAVIPLNLHFGEDILKDGEEIWAEEYYRRLTMEVSPFTSQPSPMSFKNFTVKSPDRRIPSSPYIFPVNSETVKSARLAAEQLQKERRVVVVDSGDGLHGLGFNGSEV